jgi:hopene-associated glycosyltransferase HpnB
VSASALTTTATLSVVLWLGLLLLRGGFWRANQRLGSGARDAPRDGDWPSVAVVIPARNEADGIGRAVASVLAQDYSGPLRLFVTDDNSDDGTAEVARAAAGQNSDRLTIVPGAPLTDDWTGKMWAVAQGIARAGADMPGAEYLLLTDGDIEHSPDNLRRLVAKAEADGLALTSLMVKLRCRTGWERLLVPAFVFFFQKLYPFPWVNDPRRATAAAAGGCMLVRARALAAAGGIERIRDRVIDDCALARLLKPRGPIWLGLTDDADSLRPYDRLRDIWGLVARTAFVQLEHSLLALFGTVLGMTLMYLVPPAAVVAGLAAGNLPAAGAGAGAWLLMALAYRPTLGLYGQSPARGLLLPVAGVLYTAMTLDSARRHLLDRGSEWKGRSYGTPGNRDPQQ